MLVGKRQSWEEFFDLYEKRLAEWILLVSNSKDPFILHKLLPAIFRNIKAPARELSSALALEGYLILGIVKGWHTYDDPGFAVCKLFDTSEFISLFTRAINNKLDSTDGEITQKIAIDHIDVCERCNSLAQKAIDLYMLAPTDEIKDRALSFSTSEFWEQKRSQLIKEKVEEFRNHQKAEIKPINKVAIIFIAVSILLSYAILSKEEKKLERTGSSSIEISKVHLPAIQQVKINRTSLISISIDQEWQHKLSILEKEASGEAEKSYLTDYDRSFTRDPQRGLYTIYQDALTKYLQSRSISDYRELEGIAAEIAGGGDQTALDSLREIESIDTQNFLRAIEILSSMGKLSSLEEKGASLKPIKSLLLPQFAFLYLHQELTIAPIEVKKLSQLAESAASNRHVAEWCIYRTAIARALLEENRFIEALPMLVEVVEVSKEIGLYDAMTRSLILLSNSYSVTDQHALTLRHAFELLQVSRKDQRIAAATNIAISLYALGYKALALYTLDLAEELTGPAHNRINARAIKCQLLAMEGKTAQSLQLINQVWLEAKLLDSKHNGYILGRLARTKGILADWLGAEELYRETIAFAEKSYPDNYLALAQLYQGMSEVSDRLMKCKQSKEYIEKAIENWNKAKELLPYKQNPLLNFAVTDKSPLEVKVCLG